MLKANLIFTNKPIAEYMEIKNKISCCIVLKKTLFMVLIDLTY